MAQSADNAKHFWSFSTTTPVIAAPLQGICFSTTLALSVFHSIRDPSNELLMKQEEFTSRIEVGGRVWPLKICTAVSSLLTSNRRISSLELCSLDM
jgi:hypothetical protein